MFKALLLYIRLFYIALMYAIDVTMRIVWKLSYIKQNICTHFTSLSYYFGNGNTIFIT